MVTEEDDFILGELVWFGVEMRLERGSASPASHSRGHTVFLPTNLANSTILGGGAPVLMAHLGKVVLFFSQGLRTDSRGQAINQKDQGQGMPCLNLSPQPHQPLFKEPSQETTIPSTVCTDSPIDVCYM